MYYAYFSYCFSSFPTDSKNSVLISTLIPLGVSIGFYRAYFLLSLAKSIFSEGGTFRFHSCNYEGYRIALKLQVKPFLDWAIILNYLFYFNSEAHNCPKFWFISIFGINKWNWNLRYLEAYFTFYACKPKKSEIKKSSR